MGRRSILMLMAAVSACGSPQDRLTNQQATQQPTPAENDGTAPGDDALPPPPPAGQGPLLYRAIGNEPGWSLSIFRQRMDYLGNYGEVRISEPTPAAFRPQPGRYAGARVRFAITPGPCSDGMSDLTYRHNVRIIADGREFAGCGGGTIAPGSLAGTSWTVTAVNGRATGGGQQYYLRFERDRVAARFGCNAIGGSWSQNGDHVATRDLAQTLMGCPEPAASFETQGGAILRSNMRLETSGGTRARLVSEAGSIDLARSI